MAQICGNLWYDPINKDGTPKGYQLFRECGGEFSWEYRSLGSPAVRQLRVWQPGQVEAFPGSVVAKIWNWDPCWTVVWYEDGRYRGAMQRIQIVDPDYAAHLDSLKNAGGNSPNRSIPASRTSISKRVLRLRHRRSR